MIERLTRCSFCFLYVLILNKNNDKTTRLTGKNEDRHVLGDNVLTCRSLTQRQLHDN